VGNRPEDPEQVARRRERARERQRRYRARKRAEVAADDAEQQVRAGVVAELRPDDEQVDDNSVVDAVRAELDRLVLSRERPGVAAAALRLAAVLDDPTATPQAPAAARALHALLDDLRVEGEGRGGKLAELRRLHRVG
jgi:hypothetical protein